MDQKTKRIGPKAACRHPAFAHSIWTLWGNLALFGSSLLRVLQSSHTRAGNSAHRNFTLDLTLQSLSPGQCFLQQAWGEGATVLFVLSHHPDAEQHLGAELDLLTRLKRWECAKVAPEPPEERDWVPSGALVIFCSCSSRQRVGYLEGLFSSQRTSFPVTCSFQWTNQLGDGRQQSFSSLSFISLFKNKMLKESCGHRTKKFLWCNKGMKTSAWRENTKSRELCYSLERMLGLRFKKTFFFLRSPVFTGLSYFGDQIFKRYFLDLTLFQDLSILKDFLHIHASYLIWSLF